MGEVVNRFVASTGKDPYLTRKGYVQCQDQDAVRLFQRELLGHAVVDWAPMMRPSGERFSRHGDGLRSRLFCRSLLAAVETGCIMLSDKNAKTLYEWAEMGTTVWIH